MFVVLVPRLHRVLYLGLCSGFCIVFDLLQGAVGCLLLGAVVSCGLQEVCIAIN